MFHLEPSPTRSKALREYLVSARPHVPERQHPVVQLSINGLQTLDYHLDIGARFAPLRNEGVLTLGSGNVVHDLGRIGFNQPSGGFDWNHRFDEAASSLMRGNAGDILSLVGHDDYDLAVPTPDHFITFALHRRTRRSAE